ncbi:MAG TPA: hypothetical protein VGK73_31675 [Polyangiaceae bacterium]
MTFAEKGLVCDVCGNPLHEHWRQRECLAPDLELCAVCGTRMLAEELQTHPCNPRPKYVWYKGELKFVRSWRNGLPEVVTWVSMDAAGSDFVTDFREPTEDELAKIRRP